MWFSKVKKKREYKRTFTEDEIRDAEIPSATEKLAQKSLANWVEAMREASWGGLNDRFAEGGEVTDFNLNEAVFLGEPAGGFPEDRETAVGRARANQDPNHIHEWILVDYRGRSFFHECWCLSKMTTSDKDAQELKTWVDGELISYQYTPLKPPKSIFPDTEEADQLITHEMREAYLREGLSAFRSFNNPGVIVGDPTPVLTIQDVRPRASDGRLFWGCKHHRYRLKKVENDIMYFSCKDCVEFYTTPRWHWRALLKGHVKL